MTISDSIISALAVAVVALLGGYGKVVASLRRSKIEVERAEAELAMLLAKSDSETKETAEKTAVEAWEKWSNNVYGKFNAGLRTIDKLQNERLKLATELTEVRTQLAESNSKMIEVRTQLAEANSKIVRLQERVNFLEKSQGFKGSEGI